MWAFGMREQVLFFLPFLAVITGWSISTDTSSDGTALWMHVASPLRGVEDRAGRAVAALLVLSPVVVVLTVFLAVVTGHAHQLPALLGAALGAFLSALGVASVMSAAVVMRVQQAGENPFGVKQGASVATVLLQMGGMVSVGVLALPEIGLAIASVAAAVAGAGLGGAARRPGAGHAAAGHRGTLGRAPLRPGRAQAAPAAGRAQLRGTPRPGVRPPARP